jgi:bifunctional non-homologous end joining protein LigD
MASALKPRPASRTHHPAKPSSAPGRSSARSSQKSRGKRGRSVEIPLEARDLELEIGGRTVSLTNLDKVFWPAEGITKGDLLRYYAAIAPVLLPHLLDRAMGMKRYPNGVAGKFFFMKRAPSPRPEWIATCSIEHASGNTSGNTIAFPIVRDLASLLWIINLGCIDLNPWYARCDDVDRPDYLHFDLDPTPEATFDQVREAALAVREALVELGMKPLVKTTGSRGVHVYVPIVRGPTQKEVWAFAKRLSHELAHERPKLLTAEYRVAARPPKHVLVDYNQNAWGRTLASVYSVRPKPRATVSAPLGWDELEAGAAIEDFRLDNMPARVGMLGDLWKPLLSSRGRFPLSEVLDVA